MAGKCVHYITLKAGTKATVPESEVRIDEAKGAGWVGAVGGEGGLERERGECEVLWLCFVYFNGSVCMVCIFVYPPIHIKFVCIFVYPPVHINFVELRVVRAVASTV